MIPDFPKTLYFRPNLFPRAHRFSQVFPTPLGAKYSLTVIHLFPRNQQNVAGFATYLISD